jgi:hypothetical protein
MDVNPNKVSNHQEFFMYLENKGPLGEYSDFNKEYAEVPITLLLDDISSIYRLHPNDFAYPDKEEARIFQKNGVFFDIAIKYEDLRKLWVNFLKQKL